MQPIIKGGLGLGYIPVAPDDDAPIMKTIYGKPPKETGTTRTVYGIPREEVPEKPEEMPAEEENDVLPEADHDREETDGQEDTDGEEEAPEETQEESHEGFISEKEAQLERERLIEEYEQLREKYEREAENYVLRAKEKANEIYEKTKEYANKTISDAREEAERIKEQAAADGRRLGHDEGYEKGHEEGYVNALKKCRETLMELKTKSEEITAQKEQIFMEYERALFDSIFEIAQKVTVNSLKQKDKAVITRMLRAAAKRYRSSKNVKITLSQLDIAEEAEIDDELLKEVFGKSTLVEIEILKDAPQGTLLLDNGSEITDAGVQTQLKMIEQLGKKKYRDKSFNDLLQTKREKSQESGEDGDDSTGAGEQSDDNENK